MNKDEKILKKIIENFQKSTIENGVYALGICVKNQSDACLFPQTFHDACMLYAALGNKIMKQYNAYIFTFQNEVSKVYQEMTRRT